MREKSCNMNCKLSNNAREASPIGYEDENLNLPPENFSRYDMDSEFFAPTSCRNTSEKSLRRYSNAVKHLLPFRKNKKVNNTLKIDEAGFFSLITFSWMSKYIYKAYKRGLTVDDMPLCSPFDSCDLNAQRLERLWQHELDSYGPEKASFGRAIWKFVRTRVIICCIIFSCSCLMGFISPTIFMRNLLQYLEESNDDQITGFMWAIALTCAEILRTMFFALYYSLSYRTALRLRSACLAMIYRKVFRLNSTRNTSAGEIINLYSFDGPRLYYMIIFGPMAIGGPVISICGFLTIYYILGGWALLGMITFILYYPLQFLLAHLTGYFRQKAVKESDKRIKLVTEILTSIKLIKMYAWENWFSSQVQDVRTRELKAIEKIAYCQSVGISLAPTIPVISAIATFLIHVKSGGSLSAAQAFSILVFLTKQMKTSIQVLRDGTLTFYEGSISVQSVGTKLVLAGAQRVERVVFQARKVSSLVILSKPATLRRDLTNAFSVFSFASKQLRLNLSQLHLGLRAIVIGLTTLPRFKVYTIIVVLHTQLRTALLNMRYGSDNIIQGRIVSNRFQDVLMLEESITKVSPFPPNDSRALVIENGFFCWDVSVMEPDLLKMKRTKKKNGTLLGNEPTNVEALYSINLSVSKGALIGICGPVGSGKSSLLLACLGQLKMTGGRISRAGTCAYVTQQSWIENTTLRENILFGEEYNAKKYAKVLNACVLNEDVNMMPGGDEAEIGERGVNLSGGQKQRVSLARALYSDRDIYFLDDPLSAVDPSVGIQIFEKCIMECLKKKTVIFVTGQIQFLRKFDEILVMKDGRIAERGTFDDLAKDDNAFGYIMQSGPLMSPQKGIEKRVSSDKAGESKGPSRSSDAGCLPSNISPTKLMKAEEQLRGTIKASAYRAYVTAAGGYVVSFLVILIILLNVGSNVFSSWWLAMWIKEGSGNTTIFDPATNETIISRNINDNPKLTFYMNVYASIIGLIVATCMIRGFVYTKVTMRASKMLHINLLNKILSSPMSYFERTPLGQIQNLFSRDMDEIDSRLPESVETMLQNIWAVMFSFLSITLVFHWFLLPLIFLACLYYFISRIFRVAIRDLKRMESISRGPVYSSISATVQGLPVIHAYNKENDYIRRFCKLFDHSSTIFFLSNNAMRWMAVRLDFISVIISFTTSFLVVLLKGEVAPAFAGLALTYAAQICGVFQYTIRLLSENEARFISVERIQTNIEKLKPEGNPEETMNVTKDWPSKGDITFEGVKLSYGSDLPDVLNDVSLSISGGEKIGVVGRTGAGKSSLIAALFRLVELSSGAVYIDGLNIARVPLSALRSRLSVIPQDPTLFSESLRLNLDPFNTWDVDVLWEVLRKTRLIEKVKSMPNQMETYVGEGENLSVGEKQLVCLARTLLRGSKILVLDEATASIDPETEMAVQTTIQEEFNNCTVITIAHRLSTVKNCDRILVIDQGKVVEFDHPQTLMKNPNSQFYKMVEASEFH